MLWKKNALTEEERDMKNGFSKWIARMQKAKPGEKIDIPQERKIELDDFYHWLEGGINKKIKEELASNRYEIVPGDNLESIASKFHMDLGLLKSLNNNILNESLRSGQELHIPSTYKNRRDILMQTLSKFSENINYPVKFYAILKIIQDGQPMFSFKLVSHSACQSGVEKRPGHLDPRPRIIPIIPFLPRGDNIAQCSSSRRYSPSPFLAAPC